MVTELKTLEVALPDIGEMVADVLTEYDKKLTNIYSAILLSDETINGYCRIWLDTMFQRGKVIYAKRRYDLAHNASKD